LQGANDTADRDEDGRSLPTGCPRGISLVKTAENKETIPEGDPYGKKLDMLPSWQQLEKSYG
jgi:hypothetical protein